MTRAKKSSGIYRIKITLRHVAPPIWRRIEVTANTKLGKLHRILQVVMGWTDSHLHAFRVGRTSYGVPQPEFPGDMENERNVRLDQIAAQCDKLIYEYACGGGGDKPPRVKKIVPADPTAHYPRCTAGSRACPPEDCG